MDEQWEWTFEVCSGHSSVAKFLNSLDKWQTDHIHIVQDVFFIVYYRRLK